MIRTRSIAVSSRAWGDALRFALGFFAAFALLAVLAGSAMAATGDEDDGPDFGQYLTIKFVDGTSSRERLEARAAVGAAFEISLAGPLLQQATVPDGQSPQQAADALSKVPAVEYAVASGEYRADDIPNPYFNDSFLAKQWSLNDYGQVFMSRIVNGAFVDVSGTPGADINAPEAWDQVTPGALTPEMIGIVDTGVAYQHPDLADNMVTGGDFYDGDNDPRDVNGHGTHVASIAGGVADNDIGTAGVDPWAKLMPLRAADEYGTFSWAAIEQAVSFGLSHGVRLFNGSFGGPDDDPAFEDLIASNPQALFVFSAGNGHRWPCDSTAENVVCVGSSDWTDTMSRFSDYGTTSVDLVAPGSSIYAAKPCAVPAPDDQHQTECPYDPVDQYAPVGLGGGPFAFQLLSGTSMAAPQVTGAAALLWSKCPNLKSSQIKGTLVGNVDPIATMTTKVAYGGRLNVGNAMTALASCPGASDGTDWPTPPAQPSGPSGDGGGTGPTGGGSTGGGGPTGPTGGTTPTGLKFQIIRPLSAKVGKVNKVKFKLKCSAICSATVSVQPLAKGVVFKKFKGTLKSGTAGTRSVATKVPSSTLRAVRALLTAKTKVRLRFSVIVSDKSGAKSDPIAFSVKLSK
jgi:subtilisin family serine protease